MEKGTAIISKGMAIIINACIWGLVILGCSYRLRGTGAYQEIQNILAAGAALSCFTIMAVAVFPSIVTPSRKKEQDES